MQESSITRRTTHKEPYDCRENDLHLCPHFSLYIFPLSSQPKGCHDLIQWTNQSLNLILLLFHSSFSSLPRNCISKSPKRYHKTWFNGPCTCIGGEKGQQESLLNLSVKSKYMPFTVCHLHPFIILQDYIIDILHLNCRLVVEVMSIYVWKRH